MISFSSRGDFSKTFNFLNNTKRINNVKLDGLAQQGVTALINNSPKDTGLMKSSWGYDIKRTNTSITISWNNSDIENGCNVAILVQYGHATKSGTYIKGVDFINPALRPVFEQIADEVWKEVTR